MSRGDPNQYWCALYWPLHILSQTISMIKPKRKLSDLPLELVEHIFSFLPLPSKVCLAISSKGFYRLFSHVLGAKELRFPLMPRDESLKYVSSEAYRLRMTLLAQLENRGWACCGRCQKLHRRHEFHENPLRYAPWGRACATYAGIMDLCPCVSLTIRDRARVIEHLEGTFSQKRCLGHIKKGIMSLHYKDGEQYLSHTCTAYPELESEIKLSLTESGQLISRAQYAGRTDRDLRSGSVPVCCSRLFTTETLNATPAPVKNCAICHSRVQRLPHPTGNTGIVYVTRFLGSKDWFADSSQCACGGSGGLENGWYIQSRPPSEYIAEEMKIPTMGIYTGRCRCSMCIF